MIIEIDTNKQASSYSATTDRWRVGAGGTRAMKSLVIKRSVFIGGHKTSVSLEDPFWNSLKEIAADKKTTPSGLVASIDAQKGPGSLSSAIRLFVLSHYQTRADDHGYVGQKAA